MPTPLWNDDFTGADLAELALAYKFISALNERALAANRSDLMISLTSFPPAAGSVVSPLWLSIQSRINTLAIFFVKEADYAGTSLIECLGISPSSAPGKKFPAPNGFTRKFPREIYALANPGAAGQIARFTARINTGWFGLSTGPAFNTLVTTPVGERKHSGELFEHDGTNWVPYTGPPRAPDVVTDYGLGRSGDYIGSWIANELRDAMNLMVWTIGIGFSGDGSTPLGGGIEGNNSHGSICVPLDDPAFVSFREGSASTQAQAEANFLASGQLESITPHAISRSRPSPPNYLLSRGRGYVRSTNIPDNEGKTRDVVALINGRRPTPNANYPGGEVWDANGDNITEGTWTEVGAQQNVGTSYQSPLQGNVTALPAWAADTTQRGSGWAGAAMITKWNVVGGFEYTAASTL